MELCSLFQLLVFTFWNTFTLVLLFLILLLFFKCRCLQCRRLQFSVSISRNRHTNISSVFLLFADGKKTVSVQHVCRAEANKQETIWITCISCRFNLMHILSFKLRAAETLLLRQEFNKKKSLMNSHKTKLMRHQTHNLRLQLCEQLQKRKVKVRRFNLKKLQIRFFYFLCACRRFGLMVAPEGRSESH